MYKTLNKILKLMKSQDIDELCKELEYVCTSYDLMKSTEWASRMHILRPIDNDSLPIPRLEMRWRDDIVASEYGDSTVADIGIVFKFGKEIRYDILSSTMTSDLNAPDNLYIPFRKESDNHALMYQLNLPSFITHKDEYKEIEFPKEKDALAYGVLDIMSKEDIKKLK